MSLRLNPGQAKELRGLLTSARKLTGERAGIFQSIANYFDDNDLHLSGNAKLKKLREEITELRASKNDLLPKLAQIERTIEEKMIELGEVIVEHQEEDTDPNPNSEEQPSTNQNVRDSSKSWADITGEEQSAASSTETRSIVRPNQIRRTPSQPREERLSNYERIRLSNHARNLIQLQRSNMTIEGLDRSLFYQKYPTSQRLLDRILFRKVADKIERDDMGIFEDQYISVELEFPVSPDFGLNVGEDFTTQMISKLTSDEDYIDIKTGMGPMLGSGDPEQPIYGIYLHANKELGKIPYLHVRIQFPWNCRMCRTFLRKKGVDLERYMTVSSPNQSD